MKHPDHQDALGVIKVKHHMLLNFKPAKAMLKRITRAAELVVISKKSKALAQGLIILAHLRFTPGVEGVSSNLP